ncbi:hypothetical protein B9Z55_020217 [Caenorhabditis nigoni]|uniref:Uncharacterized protein n=1 Tax=Caenorhabditis nigoni TaxID=1611254 RepID=A0A2G5TLR9_9PELO|nr:hypothetical protein B9Z55_020217 [Caenorhabditis nigoni]
MSTESTTWPFSQLPYLDQLDKDINLFGMRNRNGTHITTQSSFIHVVVTSKEIKSCLANKSSRLALTVSQKNTGLHIWKVSSSTGGRHNGVLHFRNSPKEEHRCYVGGRRSCSRSQGGGNQEKKKVSGTAKRLADEIAVGAVETEVHEDVPKPKNEN